MVLRDRRQMKILVLIGALIVGSILFIAFKDNFSYNNSFAELDPVSGDKSTIDEFQKNDHEPQTIKIYIAGQVRNPGVIEVPSNCRLVEAVEMAGGFLDDADLLKVNLAIRVQDEGMYLIPKKGEAPPLLNSDAQGDQQITGKININTADQSQLETLPRIGPVTARNIIEYREQNGPFKSIEDLMNVPRIGEKTFEGLKDLITVY